LQVFSEALTANDFVPFTVIIGTVLFFSGRCKIVMDWYRALDPWLILDGVEDLIYGESERSEVLYRLESLE